MRLISKDVFLKVFISLIRDQLLCSKLTESILKSHMRSLHEAKGAASKLTDETLHGPTSEKDTKKHHQRPKKV